MNILFVCTGNLCRSPMAHAILEAKAKERGLDISVRSCGVLARRGTSPTYEAVKAAEKYGGDLSGFHSSPCDADAVEWADHVFCMSQRHLAYICSVAPQHVDKARLLLPSGEEIDDPIGAAQDVYLQCAWLIDQAISKRLGEICE